MSDIPIPRALSAPARAAGALLLLVVLVATMLTVLPTQARAAINSKITVSDLSLVVSDPNGKEDPNNTSVQTSNILKLKFAWDASNADAKSGDSFEIGLPEQIRNRENLTEPMTVTHQGESHKVGECVMSEHKITCTFNDTLDAITTQGFSGLRGTGSALMVAAKTTDSATLTVNANGTETPVSIPGGKITEYVGGSYKPETVSKWANDLTADAEKVTWELTFGPAQIKEALEKNGQSLAVDGKTRSTITFTDELGPGQTYVSNKDRWRLGTGTVEGKKTNHFQLTDGTGADQNTSEGDFDLDVSINGDVATIKVTGPFAPRSNYIIYYESTPNTANGKIQAGVQYRNNATALGSGLEYSYTLHYTKSFTINVELKPGFGGFDVTKLLTGAETGKVPDGTTFKVGVHYELPGGAKTDAYPGWTAPGTVNQDGTGGDAEMSVTVGAKTVFNGTFPTGTILTLNEDTSTASTAPAGLAWGAPTFTVEGQSTNTLTVEDQKSTAVTLSNSANSVPVDEGDFTITKALAGDGDFSKSAFVFTYNCTDGTTGLLTVTGATTSEKSKKVKAGSTCTVTEDGDKATQNGYTLTAPDAQTVEIAKDQTAEVTMTNTYTSDKGSFSVAKTATGAQVGDKEFTFSYTCDNDAKDTLKVKADGTAVPGPQLPVGTKCTIEEDAQSAQVDGYTLEAPASQDVTIDQKDKVVATSFTNTYTAKPSPSPSPSESASPAPSESASPTPSVSPSESASPSPSASESPSPSESASPAPSESASSDPGESTTPTPSESASSDPGESTTPTPSESASSDPGESATSDDPSSLGSDPAVSGSTSGDSSDPAGGPLASTGVRIGLPLAVAVFAVMGGALLVSRRRA